MNKQCKGILILLLFILFSQTSAQSFKSEILEVLSLQEKAWNEGNLEEYMNGYWKSDSLKFIGKSGVTYGWKATLERYKKGYPNRDSMGLLSFSIISIEKIDDNNAFVVGKWHLKREIGDIEGYFSLIFKQIDKYWVIIADHSS